MVQGVPVYDSARTRSRAIEELVEAWRYRNLIIQLVRRDVLTRYKRSVLGVAWTMLNPLGMMLVLTIAFSQIFGGVRAYPAYVLSGLVAWTYFAQVTAAAMHQMVWGGMLLNKIYIPRTVFVLSSIGTGLVNLVLSIVPLVAVLLVTGVPLRWTIVFLPVPMLLLSLFALGISLIISTWAVYFPDVAEMYQIVLTAWMYLTPIIYPEEIVPEVYRQFVFSFNPMYHLVTLFRKPIYEGVIPSFPEVGWAFLATFLVAALGWWIFTRKSDEFAYRI
jgi:ABC-2 type transport system permease protein